MPGEQEFGWLHPHCSLYWTLSSDVEGFPFFNGAEEIIWKILNSLGYIELQN